MLKRLITPLPMLLMVFSVAAQPVASAPQTSIRLRATIEKVEPDSITVRDRSGEVITLVRPADMAVLEVFPIALADIKAGSYIGTAAMPQADGTQLALEVLVFPESARGSAEGHRPYDLQAQSTMTNATVADLVAAPSSAPGGQKLVLKYKDGEKTVIVPANVPVVSFKPGKDDEKALVVPGARVVITAEVRDGKPTALRMLVGRDGFAPPM